MTKPKWLFDESIPVGVDYTDESLVADYDNQHELFRDFPGEARKVAAALELTDQSTVLDIGCGTGGLTTHLAKICQHVYAVDASAVMLERLRDKIKQQDIQNVTITEAGFLTHDHTGAALDGIVCNIALHHLPDFWKQIALCRFHDMLKPGGKLLLVDVVFGFAARDYQTSIDDWLQSMRKMAGDQMAEETVVHVRDEYSTWGWVMEGILKRAGFTIQSDDEVMPNMRAYVCEKGNGR